MGTIRWFSNKYAELFALIVFYVFGANLFLILKVAGVEQFSIPVLHGEISIYNSLGNTFLAGLTIGVSVWHMEKRIITTLEQHMTYWQVSLIRCLLLTVIIIGTGAFVHFTMSASLTGSIQSGLEQTSMFLNSGIFKSLFVYFFLFSYMIHFSRQVSQRMGHNVIINYLLGRYKEPIEEDRTFMFLDLNESTRIAESLGHIQYSAFLNDFFNEFTTMLSEYPVELYQFVGDEIVVTWRVKRNQQPIGLQLFEAFSKRIDDKREDYLETYGEVPKFKAALHTGSSIQREVGTLRKEIVYHGDVLNTCSRLLGQCKKYKKRLLVSGEYLETVNHQSYGFEWLGEMVLRGKTEPTSIYTIKTNED
ncbi:MAG: adenylate/guanylate cyclase domain-containing protein [Bacteroidota bacterium]